ncbi:chain length determinant protein [delta proteobacterium NaphS2]|nr:chain length determinant protein [delta proteobacterium NaphS2]
MKEIQQENKPYEPDIYEDEIHLMDLVDVIWKWKYLIVIGTLLCVGIGVFISFKMPRLYRITTVLEPGVVHLDRYGRVVRTCRGQELKNLLETNALNGRILKNLKSDGFSEVPKQIHFEGIQPKNSDILEVRYETPNPEIGIQVLKELNKLLLKNYEGLVNRWKGEYAKELTSKKGQSSELVQKIVREKNSISSAKVQNAIKISQIETKIGVAQTRISSLESEQKAQLGRKNNDIQKARSEIESKKKEIKSIEERIHDVNQEIERIGGNTDRLIKERDRFLSKPGADNGGFASVMYVTTLQQNMAYANDLRSTVNDLNRQIFQGSLAIEKLETGIKDIELEKSKLMESISYQIKDLRMDMRDYENQMGSLKEGLQIEIDNAESEIKALEIEKESVDEEINQLEIKRNDVENIQIRKEPTASIGPVKPNKKLNIALALVVGIFLSVFLAFFLEALSKRKSERIR